MKYDYKFDPQGLSTLKSMIGRRMVSYRLNETDNSSFEIFVLRFQEVDVELATKEVVGIGDWFDETNTVEVTVRPNRDSWSRLGKVEPDDGIPVGGFLDYEVGKVLTGISVVAETLVHKENSLEFIRGIVLHFDDEDIVFDKGALNWEYFWHVTRCPAATYKFKVEDDPETPEVRTTVQTEKIA